MKKITILLIIIAIFGSLLFPNINYAKATINEDEFIEAFWKMLEETAKEGNNNNLRDKFSINKDTDTIVIKNEEKTTNIKYDFADGAKFSTKIKVNKGMNANDYMEESSKSLELFTPYLASLYMQNVKIKNACEYLLTFMFEGNDYITNEYPSNSKNPTVSELNANILKSLNDYYQNSKVISKDNGSKGYNTFTMTSEQTNITSDSCEIVTTIEVNLDADFEKINSFENEEKEDLITDGIFGGVEEAIKKNNEIVKSDNSQIKNLPQTGKGIETEDVLKIFVCMCVLMLTILVIKDVNIKRKSKI